MRSAFDFAPFRRSTVGFDLIREGENEYRIELAVAGFKPEELDITAQQNVLIVSGRKKDESDEKGDNYIYRGIATRSFERRFALADHIQVRGADMKDGLLKIELKREIPEAMKPKKINIGGTQPQHDRIGSDQPASEQTVNAEAEHA